MIDSSNEEGRSKSPKHQMYWTCVLRLCANANCGIQREGPERLVRFGEVVGEVEHQRENLVLLCLKYLVGFR